MHQLFVPPSVQLANLRGWNERRKWGFTDEDFARLGDPPHWPRTELQAIVLTPYLSTVQQTFNELCRLSGYFGTNVTGGRLIRGSSSSRLRLLPGIEHNRGLAWKKIDLGANRGYSPFKVRDARTAPHAEVLAAVAHFPDWVRAMDGDKIPYVRIPGYEHAFWPGIWSYAIVVGPGNVSGMHIITQESACEADNRYAVPEFPIRHLTFKAKMAPYW